MTMVRTLTLLGTIVVLLSAATASAVPATWSVNGHSYNVIDAAVNWDTAKASAELAGGHLATINSAAENQFLFDNFGGIAVQLKWLGASQSFAATSFGEGWSWVVPGEPFSFTNWNSPPEPNDGNDGVENGSENYLHYWFTEGNDGSTNGTRWNDNPNVTGIGYVIEFENAQTAPVPEPATIAFLGAALGGLAVRFIRRRKAAA